MASRALREKAGPLIKPLAGDKVAAIETAANSLSSSFAGAPSVAARATCAISGLMGPRSALIARSALGLVASKRQWFEGGDTLEVQPSPIP